MIFLNYLYTIEVTHFSIFSIRFFFYWKKTKTYLVCNVPSSDNSNSLAQKYTCLHESLFFLLHCPSLHAACGWHHKIQQMYQKSSWKFFKQSFTFSSTNKKGISFAFNGKKDSERNVLWSFVLLSAKDSLFLLKHCPQNVYPFFFFHVLKLFWLCQLGIRSLNWLPASAFGFLEEKSHLVFYILLVS